MSVRISPDLPLNIAVEVAKSWWNTNASKRREDMERGMRRHGHDDDSIEEALISFDENDAECRAQFLNAILDGLADIRRGVSPGGITLQ